MRSAPQRSPLCSRGRLRKTSGAHDAELHDRLSEPQGSIVASSFSMTGISSLIGYTRLHCAHLSAVPSLTSVTGVLQFGHARMSSNSGSIGMANVLERPLGAPTPAARLDRCSG